jgi:hypothetical protein
MSTKIYSAFQWKGRGGVRGVLDHLALTMHGRVVDRAVKRMVKNDDAVAAWDLSTGNANDSWRQFGEHFKTILSGSMRDSLNFSSAASVFPDADGEVYVVFNSLDSLSFGDDCPECFVDAKLWRDFHYQNSTDGPDDVKKKDWERRRKTWDKLFSRCGPDAHTFAHASLTYDFITPEKSWIILSLAAQVFARTRPRIATSK